MNTQTPRTSAATGETFYRIVEANDHYAMRKNIEAQALDAIEALLDPTCLGPGENHLTAILNNLMTTSANVYRHERNVIAYFIMHTGERRVEGRRNGTFFCRYDLSAADFTAEQEGLLARGYVNLGGLGWAEYVRELHPELAHVLNSMQARRRTPSDQETFA